MKHFQSGSVPEHYLTESPIASALMRLALPIMASSFFATAYNITDMIWIGKLGSKALAGVGTAGMYTWFSNGLANLARMGGQVHTAQQIGRRDLSKASDYAQSSLRLVIVLGLGYGLLCLLLARPLILILGIREEEAVADGVLYLRMTSGLCVFPFVNTVLTGLYTAQGDSRTPLKANVIGLLANMLLDPLLVLGPGFFPRLGVMGGAIATVLAQILSLLIFTMEQLSRHAGKGEEGQIRLLPPAKPKHPRYREIVHTGLPSALQTSLYCAFSMFLTGLAAKFGSGAVAVQRLGGQIESLTWNAADGFAMALNAFTGQNYGAQKYDRIRKGYHIAAGIVLGWGVLITLIFLLFPMGISRLFFYEPDVLRICVSYLVIVGLSEPFMSVELVANGAICGFGETLISSRTSIILTGMRIPLALLFNHLGWGLSSVWWALTLTSMAKGIVLDQVFRRIWKRKREAIPPIRPSAAV